MDYKHDTMKTVLEKFTRSRARRRTTATAARQKRSNASLRPAQILVPVDFSKCSREALDYALWFASKFQASLTLVHVVHANYGAASSEYSTFDYPALIEEMRRFGERELAALARRVQRRCPVKTVLKTGHPGDAIVAVAREFGSDLIIISTHGRTGLKRVLLGSTTEYVVRHASCPVFVVRREERDFVE